MLAGDPVQLRRAKGSCAPDARWKASSSTSRFQATSVKAGTPMIRSSASAANSGGRARARSTKPARTGGCVAAKPWDVALEPRTTKIRERRQRIRLGFQRHGLRIPGADALFEVADVGKQGRTRGAESECR